MYDSTNSPIVTDCIVGMVEDHADNKWIATHNGLLKWNNEGWTHYDSENSGLPENHIFCLAIDDNDVLWMSTTHGGLTRFDGLSWNTYGGIGGIHDISINNNTGDIWVCIWNSGIAKFDGNNYTFYDTPDSPYEIDLNYNIAIENDTTLWITTIAAGLARLCGNELTVLDSTNSDFTAESSYFIAIDHEDNKYVTTNNGLFIIDKNGMQTMLDTGYFINNSLNKTVWGIIATQDSSIWIGGRNLIKYKNGEWQKFSLAELPPYGRIDRLYKDRNGNLWAWILEKLYYLDFTTNVPENFNCEQVLAYPNPFNDKINLSILGNQNIEKVLLYDISGKLVHSQKNTQYEKNIEINVPYLNSGYYFAYIQTSNTKKINYIKLTKN
ncbi:MAG: T9SS type A sorting domain-containing protein [Bacteroidales bacterium]|nr:T9SS type A sorting domain-containing protein [Bacteroidales bacterium]